MRRRAIGERPARRVVRAIVIGAVLSTACSNAGNGGPSDGDPEDGATEVVEDAPDGLDGEADAPAWPALDLATYVDPLLGTAPGAGAGSIPGGGAGNTFPGASAPFGMLQWGPDTTSAPWPAYSYRNTRIKGFSLTHLSGAGCPALGDFPFIPTTELRDASPETEPAAYRQPFSHSDERAEPGFYEVLLGDGIRVALTATPRSGVAEVEYPDTSAGTGRLLISSGSMVYTGSYGADAVATRDAELAVGPDGVLRGSRTSGGFCGAANSYTVHFAARFDPRPVGHGAWKDATLTPDADTVTGDGSGMYFDFDLGADRVVRIKVGLSFVSQDGALANLDAENPGWDFAAVRAAVRSSWNDLLNRVHVAGATDEGMTALYTALYHVLLHPNAVSDVDGRYPTFTGAVGTVEAGRVRYGTFSGWDVYRSWAPLVALLFPERMSDIVESLVQSAWECGGLPLWPLIADETGVMVGDPASATIAAAYAFGARDFDAAGALDAIANNADRTAARCNGHPARPGLRQYVSLGYIPKGAAGVWGPPATTLEYALADFAIAQYAGALGRDDLRAGWLARSLNWRNVFNPDTGYVQERWTDGSWVEPFDPASDLAFVEGNAAQYTFMVPHDLAGLVESLGGPERTRARLDDHFQRINAGTDQPYFTMGNEPEFATPYLYTYARAPWKTQQILTTIIDALFVTGPSGLPGNDDLGAMSSWYFWSTIGLYPTVPGVAGFAIATPRLPRVQILLPDGAVLDIAAEAAGPDARYVRGLRVDGATRSQPWVFLADLAHGARLEFDLGADPDETWGASPADVPPSFVE